MIFLRSHPHWMRELIFPLTPADKSCRRFAISTYWIRLSIDVLFIAPRNAKLMGFFNKIRARNRSRFMAIPFRMAQITTSSGWEKCPGHPVIWLTFCWKRKRDNHPTGCRRCLMHVEAATLFYEKSLLLWIPGLLLSAIHTAVRNLL